jgi:hypothetical protein
MGDEQSYEKGYHFGYIDSNFSQFGKKPWFLLIKI